MTSATRIAALHQSTSTESQPDILQWFSWRVDNEERNVGATETEERRGGRDAGLWASLPDANQEPTELPPQRRDTRHQGCLQRRDGTDHLASPGEYVTKAWRMVGASATSRADAGPSAEFRKRGSGVNNQPVGSLMIS